MGFGGLSFREASVHIRDESEGKRQRTDGPAEHPEIATGAILAYRLFQAAYEIDLSAAERSLSARSHTAVSRGRFEVTPSRAMTFGVAPLELALEPVTLPLKEGPVHATVSVRAFDFGIISIAVRLAVAQVPWPEFADRLEAVQRAVGSGAGAAFWSNLLQQIRHLLGEAMIRPTSGTLEEDYLVAVVNAFDTPLSAAELQERIDLVPLLSGERRALSDTARQELLRQQFSYYTDDLVVLTWDRAFIYEPRGDSDVIDVLEVANAQLLEMRSYEALLDAELPGMYDAVEAARRAWSIWAPRRYANLARRLYTMVAEVTELTGKVENALQVTGDVYLARIYTAALDVFRVRATSASVDRKLATIRETYTALNDEASGRRGEWLEVAILVLILMELVLPFLRG